MSSPVILADVENRGMAVAVNKGNDSSIRPNIQSTLSEQALGVQNEQCTEAEPEVKTIESLEAFLGVIRFSWRQVFPRVA